MLGMVNTCRGKLYNYCLANILHNEPVRFKSIKQYYLQVFHKLLYSTAMVKSVATG